MKLRLGLEKQAYSPSTVLNGIRHRTMLSVFWSWVGGSPASPVNSLAIAVAVAVTRWIAAKSRDREPKRTPAHGPAQLGRLLGADILLQYLHRFRVPAAESTAGKSVRRDGSPSPARSSGARQWSSMPSTSVPDFPHGFPRTSSRLRTDLGVGRRRRRHAVPVSFFAGLAFGKTSEEVRRAISPPACSPAITTSWPRPDPSGPA